MAAAKVCRSLQFYTTNIGMARGLVVPVVSMLLVGMLLTSRAAGQQLLIRTQLLQSESWDMGVTPSAMASGAPQFVPPISEEHLSNLKAAGLGNIQAVGSQGWASALLLRKNASLDDITQQLLAQGFQVERDAIVVHDQQATDQAADAPDIVPDDTLWPDVQGWHKQIHATEAWKTATATDIKVCTVDSGAQTDHPDLKGNINNGNVFNILSNSVANAGNDERGHGTHVAGIIGAVGNNGMGMVGVAWRVPILACRFIGKDGTGKVSQAINCIRWCREQGARIINNSWGYPTGGNNVSQALQHEIEVTQSAGILLVWSAGNAGKDMDADGASSRPFNVRTPAVIVVGAVRDDDQRSGYSNYGKELVHLFAPGDNIMSTVPGGSYGRKGGTSMAAPMVAGALALMWGTAPNMAADQVKAALLSGTDRVAGTINSTSGGRLNVAGAMSALQQTAQSASNPAFRYPEGGCMDQQVECAEWLMSGYCNATYMHHGKSVAYELCAASCGLCDAFNNSAASMPPDLTGVWLTGGPHNLLVNYNVYSRCGYAMWCASPTPQTLTIRHIHANMFLFHDPWGRAYLANASVAVAGTEAQALQIIGSSSVWSRLPATDGLLGCDQHKGDGNSHGSSSMMSAPASNNTGGEAMTSAGNSSIAGDLNSSTADVLNSSRSSNNESIINDAASGDVMQSTSNAETNSSSLSNSSNASSAVSTTQPPNVMQPAAGNATEAASTTGSSPAAAPEHQDSAQNNASTLAQADVSNKQSSSHAPSAESSPEDLAAGVDVPMDDMSDIQWPGAYDFRKMYKVLEQLAEHPTHPPAEGGGKAPTVTLRMVMQPAGLQL